MIRVDRNDVHGRSGVNWSGVLAVGLLLLAVQTFGSDQPIITVSRDALSPGVIEVHVGEMIRWQAQVASICTCTSTPIRRRTKP